jgi:hypothetical protein
LNDIEHRHAPCFSRGVMTSATTCGLLLAVAACTGPAADSNEIAKTPFGAIHSSCVHQVENGATVMGGQVIAPDGGVTQTDDCGYQPVQFNGKDDATTTNGWVEYGDMRTPLGFQSLETTFTVPAPPSNVTNQLVYFFPSFEPATSGAILQPVLQWGVGPAGGGAYWSIASWYVTSSNQFFASPLATVQPGDVIDGSIVGTTGCSNGTCTEWTITTTDTSQSGASPTVLRSDGGGLSYQWAQAGVLEAYSITSCDQYPASGSLRFDSVRVLDANGTELTQPWTPQQMSVTPSCNFAVTSSTASDMTLQFGNEAPPPCQYDCKMYGFSADQCYGGWVCDHAGQCLQYEPGAC